MKDETILQQMQKNLTMDEEDLNPSCVFLVDVDVDDPHFFYGSFEWWRFTTLEKGHGF